MHPLCVLRGWEQHSPGEEITDERFTRAQAHVGSAAQGKPAAEIHTYEERREVLHGPVQWDEDLKATSCVYNISFKYIET